MCSRLRRLAEKPIQFGEHRERVALFVVLVIGSGGWYPDHELVTLPLARSERVRCRLPLFDDGLKASNIRHFSPRLTRSLGDVGTDRR